MKVKKPHKDSTLEKFDEIILEISENKASVTQAIKQRMSISTFYDVLNKDKEKAKVYARACELRADAMFEEMLHIADAASQDVIFDEEGNETVNHNVINRDRLRVDARKWALAKLNPRKYGEKLQVDASIENKVSELTSMFPTRQELDQTKENNQ